MGRPLNKRYFGADLGNNIKVHFHNGTDIVSGYIVKQVGSERFICSDVNGVQVNCLMVAKSFNDISVGEMAMTVKFDDGTVAHPSKIAGEVMTVNNQIIHWTFDPSSSDAFCQMDEAGTDTNLTNSTDLEGVDGAFTGWYNFNLTDPVSQYLTIPGSADFAPGTGDYTIEWWQYMTRADTTSDPVNGDGHPRTFSVGVYPSASLGCSIENGHFYFWSKGSYNVNFVPAGGTAFWVNNWHHVACVRHNGNITVYVDGVSKGTVSNTDNITDSTSTFYLATEQHTVSTYYSFFPGRLTNFRWTNSAVYTSNFTTPTAQLKVLANTVMLLKMSTLAGALADSTGRHTAAVVGDPTWANH